MVDPKTERQQLGIKERIGFIRSELSLACPSVRPNDCEWILSLIVAEVEAAYAAARQEAPVVDPKTQRQKSTPEQYKTDYPNLSAVPSDVLASRIVGQLILCKGNLIKYAVVLQGFIDKARAEQEATPSPENWPTTWEPCQECGKPMYFHGDTWYHVYGAHAMVCPATQVEATPPTPQPPTDATIDIDAILRVATGQLDRGTPAERLEYIAETCRIILRRAPTPQPDKCPTCGSDIQSLSVVHNWQEFVECVDPWHKS